MKILFFLTLLATFLMANAGEVVALKGKALIARSGHSNAVSIGYKLQEKDILKTEKNTKVQLKFKDNTLVTVGENSSFSIEEYFFDEKNPKQSKAKFGAMKGVFRSVTGKIGKVAPKRFELKTKTATIGIRGTTFVADQDKIACLDGAIDVTSEGVTIEIPAGKITQTLPGLPPSAPETFEGGVFGIADTKEGMEQELRELKPQAKQEQTQTNSQEAAQEDSTEAKQEQSSASPQNPEAEQGEAETNVQILEAEEELEELSLEQSEEVLSLPEGETTQAETPQNDSQEELSEVVSDTQELSLNQSVEETVETIESTLPQISYTLSGRQLGTLINTDPSKTTNQHNAVSSNSFTLERNDDILAIKNTIEKQKQINKTMLLPSLVNTTTAGAQENSSVLALDSSSYVIVWHDVGTDQINAQKYNADGSKLGSEFQITSTANGMETKISTTLLNDNRFVTTWEYDNGVETNIQAAIFNSDGTIETSVFDVSSSIQDQFNSTVTTLDDGKYVVTWMSDSGIAPVYKDIKAIIYHPNGDVHTGEFTVNSQTVGNQNYPEVTALKNGGFVVAWSNYNEVSGLASIYNSDGSVAKGDFAFTAASVDFIRATPFGDDKFILTWYEAGVDAQEVYARVYNNDGSATGSAFQINEYTFGMQHKSDIVDLGNDSFVVVWQDNTKQYIRAKIYNSDGSEKTKGFRVSEDSLPYNIRSASVGAIDDETFVISWTLEETMGSTEIYSQIFYMNESEELVSGEITSSAFDDPVSDSYLGHSYVGTFPVQSGAVSADFQVESDNLAEFIVGFADENININGEIHRYQNLFYSGAPAVMSNVEPNAIYTYDLFKLLRTQRNLDLSLSSSFNTNSGKYYYNTATNSMHFVSQTPIDERGAKVFESYYVNPDGTMSGRRLSVDMNYPSAFMYRYSDEDVIEGGLYGAQAQGLGVDTKGEIGIKIGEETREHIADTKSVQTAYLSSVQSSIPSSGTLNLSGYTNTPDNESAGLSISIDRGTGQIDTTLSGTPYSFAGAGAPSTGDAYYISADQFGIVLDSGSDGAYNYATDSGWLVSVPDTVDGSGNLAEDVDNESSWGYWTAKTYDAGNRKHIDPHSTWVAGAVTADAIVQPYIDDAVHTNMSFSGHLLGAVRTHADGAIDPIKLDSNNYINMNFDFGSGSGGFDGDAGFNTQSGEAWSATFTNGAASAFSFSAGTAEISGLGGGVPLTQGAVNGEYYGTDEIKSVGGTFNFYHGTKEASGVFKANKN